MTCYPPADWSCYPDVQSLDAGVKMRAELLGWSSLNARIAYQVPGNCPVSVRPCSKRCTVGTWYSATVSGSNGILSPNLNMAGNWVNACGCANDDCSCTTVHQVRLPGPVGAIVEVLLDGAVLDSTAYRVDNGIWLVRQDGDVWPTCQDMNLADGAPGTFTVKYIQGYPVNPLLSLAAGRLASEFAKACMDQDCALPTDVVSITRQGVTQEFEADPFASGSTGMKDVDAIIKIFNPYGLKTAPRILSPDLPAPRMRTF